MALTHWLPLGQIRCLKENHQKRAVMSGNLCNDPLKMSSHNVSCSGWIILTEYKQRCAEYKAKPTYMHMSVPNMSRNTNMFICTLETPWIIQSISMKVFLDGQAGMALVTKRLALPTTVMIIERHHTHCTHTICTHSQYRSEQKNYGTIISTIQILPDSSHERLA